MESETRAIQEWLRICDRPLARKKSGKKAKKPKGKQKKK